MGLSEASSLSKIGLGVGIAGMIFVVIGFPTNSWITEKGTVFGTTVSIDLGLFKYCGNAQGTTGCVDLSSKLLQLPDWFNATRAMVIIGFLLSVFCVVVLGIHLTVKNDVKILHITSVILALTAGICVLVGIAIFGAKRNELFPSPAELGWSFALTVVGGIILLAAGVVLLVDNRCDVRRE